MSLLMDALKRAEEAKRHPGPDSAPSGRLQLEPTDTPAARPEKGSPLPDLNSHLDAVEADLKATAAEQPGRAGASRKADPAADRQLAQNLLAGAAAPDSGTADMTGSKFRIAAIVGVGALTAIGVGGYFFWQLNGLAQGGSSLARANLGNNSRTQPSLPIPATSPVQQLPVASPAPPVASSPPRATEAAPAGRPATLASSQPNVPALPKATAAPSALPPRLVTRTSGRQVPRAAAAGSEPTASPAPANTASPSSSSPTFSINNQEPLTVRAYQALQAGRLADARNAYTQALRADPRDVDALLGLASLARRDGDTTAASDYYDRVLRQEPRNATAHAGLVALNGGGDPSQAESRLKSLIGMSQSDNQRLQNSDANATSALHFALGNVYAAQRRWSEAQQAYFKAYAADEGNPDTLYNLAISLEHLNQKPLARQYYERALQASLQRIAGFERAQAEQRIAALSR